MRNFVMVLLNLLCIYSQISTVLMYVNYTITGSSKDGDTTEIIKNYLETCLPWIFDCMLTHPPPFHVFFYIFHFSM